MALPSNAKERKGIPVTTGVLDYFPDAIAAVAQVSKIGNDQHNPGEPLHWAREKSTDHADCIARHLIERGTTDVDGSRHTAKLAWRALALLQTEIEAERRMITTAKVEQRMTSTEVKNRTEEFYGRGLTQVTFGHAVAGSGI